MLNRINNNSAKFHFDSMNKKSYGKNQKLKAFLLTHPVLKESFKP